MFKLYKSDPRIAKLSESYYNYFADDFLKAVVKAQRVAKRYIYRRRFVKLGKSRVIFDALICRKSFERKAI